MRICRLSLFVVILAIMGLLITPTIIFAEEEYNDGDDMTDSSDGGDTGNSGGNYDVNITKFEIKEHTNIFVRGDFAHIEWKVENQGTDPAYNVSLDWSVECILDDLTNGSIERLPLPLHPDSTGPNNEGRVLYPGNSISGLTTVECSYVGTWKVTLTVKVDGSYADSAYVYINVVPNFEE